MAELSLEDFERAVPLQGIVGYLNFSQGKPDVKLQKQFNDAWSWLLAHEVAEPGRKLAQLLTQKVHALSQAGSAGFGDVTQALAVLELSFEKVLPAYRHFHADLLGHLSEAQLFQPFFVVRVCEAVLMQGPPWHEADRILAGALRHLNDFAGYRPIAILETRPRGEPYEHEKHRPCPVYLRGVGVSAGPYRELLSLALQILHDTKPDILHEAGLALDLLDEIALDMRAFDHGHPATKRPNYVFGEWDPHHLDGQGRYRRFVLRQVTLATLQSWVDRADVTSPADARFEAAAVLVGTLLMASGVTGGYVGAHDSTVSLSTLMPRISRYRDAFYEALLQKVPNPLGDRLRSEKARMHQAFGGIRQFLNQHLAVLRATQVQSRFLALLYAEMGYPAASSQESARIEAPSVRFLSEISRRLTSAQTLIDGAVQQPASLKQAADLLPEVEAILKRGIACGALVDPWNMLGFQGLFPLSPAQEDTVRDTRIDELLHVVATYFSVSAKLMSESASVGESALVKLTHQQMKQLATWWDRFASATVADLRRVQGAEATESALHVASALGHWHARGEATADLAFWRDHHSSFRSPKAFALVVEALLRKHEHKAALGLLMSWLNQAEQVPLEENEHSFHALALRWILSWTRHATEPTRWPLVRRFFDMLEANAEDYWEVPQLELVSAEESEDESESPATEADDLFDAAYENVTYHDTTDDDEEGSVAEGEALGEFDLADDAERIEKHLRFLSTLARLWLVAARSEACPQLPAEQRETFQGWLEQADRTQQQLLLLLDAIHATPVPEPSGSYDSLIEYDRRRTLKEQLTYSTIAACLDAVLVIGTLRSVLGSASRLPSGTKQPKWGVVAGKLEQALLHNDPQAARELLPEFFLHFRDEPLLFAALGQGGEPRQILRARIAQTVLRALAASLPRLGLLRESYELLNLALQMERLRNFQGVKGVSEFNHLFQSGLQAVVECVVVSAQQWDDQPERAQLLVDTLERLTTPFLLLWIKHSQALQLGTLENISDEADWRKLVKFVQRYGRQLFHAKFMTLSNLRGILHRGVGPFLDYLKENDDPYQPMPLLSDLETSLNREEVEEQLSLVLHTIVENYDEYKDYKSTATQSDYGENLHLLLAFLRAKVAYERHAWQLKPLALTHEVLAREGTSDIAERWEQAFNRVAKELADEHIQKLAELEKSLGIKLRSVSNRVHERFVQPLQVDRLCALIEPAMREAQEPGPKPAFTQLESELRQHCASPAGVGLDVPQWLRRLEAEVQRVRNTQSSIATLAESLFRIPIQQVSYEDLLATIETWPKEEAE